MALRSVQWARETCCSVVDGLYDIGKYKGKHTLSGPGDLGMKEKRQIEGSGNQRCIQEAPCGILLRYPSRALEGAGQPTSDHHPSFNIWKEVEVLLRRGN